MLLYEFGIRRNVTKFSLEGKDMQKISKDLLWMLGTGTSVIALNVVNRAFDWLGLMEFSSIVSIAAAIVGIAMMGVSLMMVVYGTTISSRSDGERHAFTCGVMLLALAAATIDPGLWLWCAGGATFGLYLMRRWFRERSRAVGYLDGHEWAFVWMVCGLMAANYLLSYENGFGLWIATLLAMIAMGGSYFIAVISSLEVTDKHAEERSHARPELRVVCSNPIGSVYGERGTIVDLNPAVPTRRRSV